MIPRNQLLVLLWMLTSCVSGLSLSPDMTLIISVTFGTLLLLIIIGVVVGCVCMCYSKKQEVEYLDDRPARRSRRLQPLNSVNPGYHRGISMAEMEYYHNKARAEYGMINPNHHPPGYVDTEESDMDPEFHHNRSFAGTSHNSRRGRSTPPPSYDQSQQHHENSTTLNQNPQANTPNVIPSAPPEEDDISPPRIPPSTTQSQFKSSDTIASSSKNTQFQSETPSKKGSDSIKPDSSLENPNQKKKVRVITVEDPDRLKLKKLSMINKVKKQIETGTRSSVDESMDEGNPEISVGTDEKTINNRKQTSNRTENRGYYGKPLEETPRFKRPSDKSLTRKHGNSRDTNHTTDEESDYETSESQRNRYIEKDEVRTPGSDMGLRDSSQSDREDITNDSLQQSQMIRYNKRDQDAFQTPGHKLRVEFGEPHSRQHFHNEDERLDRSSNTTIFRSGRKKLDNNTYEGYSDSGHQQEEPSGSYVDKQRITKRKGIEEGFTRKSQLFASDATLEEVDNEHSD